MMNTKDYLVPLTASGLKKADPFTPVVEMKTCYQYLMSYKRKPLQPTVERDVDRDLKKILQFQETKDFKGSFILVPLVKSHLIHLDEMRGDQLNSFIKGAMAKKPIGQQINVANNLLAVVCNGIHNLQFDLMQLNKQRQAHRVRYVTIQVPNVTFLDDPVCAWGHRDGQCASGNEQHFRKFNRDPIRKTELCSIYIQTINQIVSCGSGLFKFQALVARQLCELMNFKPGEKFSGTTKMCIKPIVEMIIRYGSPDTIKSMFKKGCPSWTNAVTPSLQNYQTVRFREDEPFFKILQALNNLPMSDADKAVYMGRLFEDLRVWIINDWHRENSVLIHLVKEMVLLPALDNPYDYYTGVNFLTSSSLGVSLIQSLEAMNCKITCREYESRGFKLDGPMTYRVLPKTTDAEFDRQMWSTCTNNILIFDATGSSLTSKSAIYFRSFPHLSQLKLASTGIDDDGMRQLSEGCVQLTLLDVSNCQLTDNAAPYLARFVSLHVLDIRKNNLSQQGINNVRMLLPRCKTILH